MSWVQIFGKITVFANHHSNIPNVNQLVKKHISLVKLFNQNFQKFLNKGLKCFRQSFFKLRDMRVNWGIIIRALNFRICMLIKQHVREKFDLNFKLKINQNLIIMLWELPHGNDTHVAHFLVICIIIE